MTKIKSLLAFFVVASLIFTTSCSSSSLSNASATCDQMTQSLEDKKNIDSLLATLKEPRNINQFSKEERIKMVGEIYDIYPFIEKIAKDSTLSAWPNDDLSKEFMLGLFSKTETNLFTEEELRQWGFLNSSSANQEALDRVGDRLFGFEDPYSGPCGKDRGNLFAGDLYSTFYGALDVVLYFNICTPENHCFDSLSPLQEICKLFFDTAKGQSDGDLLGNQATERFLIVERRLKSDALSKEDLKAITTERGYGVYSRQQLALSVNKYAYGFTEENGYGQDKRLDALESICSWYSPNNYLVRK
jgi:hypothetical protein